MRPLLPSSCILLFILSFTTLINTAVGHWIDLHGWESAILQEARKQSHSIVAEGLVGNQQSTQGEHNVTSEVSFTRVQNYYSNFAADDWRHLPSCKQLVGVLSDAQLHICDLFHDHMAAIIQGASLGLRECRWQFRHHHWNCSGLKTDGTLSSKLRRSLVRGNVSTEIAQDPSSDNWGALMGKGSKEIAFAHAVWSAAVAQSVSRGCRDGSLSSCGCGITGRPAELKTEWKWGGCGDNLQYGYKFSQNFIDSQEQEKASGRNRERAKVLANLHNNEAGRRSVLKKTKIICKCHGVSGACSLVTCWHQLPSFREIGDVLKEKYKEATQVKMSRQGRLQVKRSQDPVPTVYDLIFVEPSPNYCKRDHSTGISGTSGRTCSATDSAPDSCKSLCCSRGYTAKTIKSTQRCKCKFVWCCQVVCEDCTLVQRNYVCN